VQDAATVTSILRRRAMEQPNREAFSFLDFGEHSEKVLTYNALDSYARNLAVTLLKLASPTNRVLLLCPPGKDYIIFFFGCLYAGLVPVPAYPPGPSALTSRRGAVRAIAKDALPALVLTTQSGLDSLGPGRAANDFCPNAVWLAPDLSRARDCGIWDPPEQSADTLAYLQYTSGSTASPRGVMLTHGNLRANAVRIQETFDLSDETRAVFWLPPYHDMGLLGGILQPVFSGFPAVLMPSSSFIQTPFLWLKAISDCQATVSGGPNFAYDLCVRRIGKAERAALDLSCWRIAFNGSEPVHLDTLDRFAEAFGPCGFSKAAFYPCYGLAESTLLVSGRKKTQQAKAIKVDLEAFRINKVIMSDSEEKSRVFVSCGVVDDGVLVADHESLRRCGDGEVGEILVRGPCVAKGYWGKSKHSKEVFGAEVAGSNAGPFLHTGDLGFIRDGELFVTGRLKDLIIIRGRNYYAEDIEESIRSSHAALFDRNVAVFSIETEDETQIIAVLEDPAELTAEEAFAVLRKAVAEGHELQLHAIRLVKRGSIPRTTSGKIQRSVCRDRFLDGSLRVVASSNLVALEPESSSLAIRAFGSSEWTQEVQRQLTSMIAARLGVATSQIDPTKPLNTLGIDSLLAVEITREIERCFGAVLPPSSFLREITISDLVAHAEIGEALPLRAHGTSPPPEQFPLSHGQRALWFLQELAPDASAYHIARACHIRGSLDLTALHQAFQTVSDRHESLRTRFSWQRSEPVQRVTPLHAVAFDVCDAEWRDEAWLLEALAAVARRPFVLASDSPLRVLVIRRSYQFCTLLVVVHHLVADQRSLEVVLEEISATYVSVVSGRALQPASEEVPFREYICWQEQFLNSQEAARCLAYWQTRLGGELPGVNLASTSVRRSVQTFEGTCDATKLPVEFSRALAALAKDEGATLFTLMLAAFDVLLYRYTGQTDIPVGTPAAGRTKAAHTNMVGYLVNPVVIRADLSGDPEFGSLLGQIRQLVGEALDHAAYPFPLLIQVLQSARHPSYSPAFQVMFHLQESGHAAGVFGKTGLEIDPVDIGFHPAQFDLTVRVETCSGLPATIAFVYNRDLMERRSVQRMMERYERILHYLLQNPMARVSELAPLSEAERRQIIAVSSGRPVDATNGCVHELFEAQVKCSPERVAIVWGEDRLSYQDLDRRARRIATSLREMGVGPEARICICLDRSPDTVAAMLGVLKAGAAYIPLDPSHPAEFLALIVRASCSEILLTQEGMLSIPREHGARIVSIESCMAREDAADFDSRAALENLSYIIFTSGSTGAPKGVGIEHRNCVAFLNWAKGLFRLGSEDAILAGTSICFDLSIFEIFLPLISGARLILARNVLEFPQLPSTKEVRLINTVPSVMAKLLDAHPSLDCVATVIFAGEPLSAKAARRVSRLTTRNVWNMYGPTEDTTYSTFECISDDGQMAPSIGSSVAGKQAYVLDGEMKLCPVGISGELYLGGMGLARGYVGQPALTAERFLPNPFDPSAGSRLYRTGDLARWRDDGRLDYVGRSDHQLKLRGFRIEPGEIEAVLGLHPDVREALVLGRPLSSGDTQLVAYVTSSSLSLAPHRLRAFLRLQLPDYMVPAHILVLDSFPLTANGKLNRQALPDPDSPQGQLAAALPRSPTEQAVAALWTEVLGTEVCDREANFFDLGGHSLLTTQLASRARKVFGVELSLRSLFESPSLAQWSDLIEQARAVSPMSVQSPIRRGHRPTRVPLSYSQQRLWFLEQMNPGSPTYVILAGLKLHGWLDVAALRDSLNSLILRHEGLRLRVEADDGRPYQLFADTADIDLQIVNLPDKPVQQTEAEARSLLWRFAATGFQLQQGPLLRVLLLRFDDRQHWFVLSLHHLIADGWSLGILARELSHFYQAALASRPAQLPPLPIQYADYACWQSHWLQAVQLEPQLAFWRQQLRDLQPLRLPTDRPYPALRSGSGATHPCQIAPDLGQSLKQLSRSHGVTLFMSLLAAFQTLLARYSGQTDILIGSVIANRNRDELEGLIGFFANTILLRTQVHGHEPFSGLLRQVRETCLEAYAHQDLPFEKLVEVLQPDRDLSRQPLFQVMLVFQNAPLPALELPGVHSEPLEVAPPTARFDLTLLVQPEEAGLKVAVEYNTDIFDCQTIERINGHYQQLLLQIAADPGTCLAQIDILSPAEQRQLEQWGGASQSYGGHHCLHEWFQQQVERTPQAEALAEGDRRLSYEELNRQANKLANYLRKQGAGPEAVVGLCLERSVEMVIGLLAILKAGAAYLPLEPNYPGQRLGYMLKDAGAVAVVTSRSSAPPLIGEGVRQVRLEEEWERIAEESPENPTSGVTPDNLAYIIYTSGSTGSPKGVAVSHHNVCPLMEWGLREMRLDSGDRVLQNLAFGFDWAIWEMLITLVSGGVLYVIKDSSPSNTLRTIQDNHITVLHSTPTVIEVLAANNVLLESLRFVCTGGEKSDGSTIRAIAALTAPTCGVYNMYGPTETAIVSTVDRVEIPRTNGKERLDNIPIGSPIGNTRAYVLDGEMKLCPVGISGELYLGGMGLARGYVGQPALTAERFLPNPFDPSAGSRLYRTGDLARWRDDGRLDYVGRSDHQLKLRGFRIEPGEIEAVLGLHPDVREALVLGRPLSSGDTQLVAYVTSSSLSLAPHRLRAFLRLQLPDYMVPAHILVLDSFPLTANGKLNRQALPDPDSPQGQLAAALPRSPTEQAVAALWTEVLGTEVCDREANFFDLGGHSLLTTQLASRARKVFGVELSLRSLFESPSLAQWSDLIEQARAVSPMSVQSPIRRGHRPTRVPLSYSQQRLWFLEQMNPGSPTYVILAGLKLHGWLDVAALRDSLNSLILRHEGLRLRVEADDGRPYQLFADTADIDLQIVNLPDKPVQQTEAEARSLLWRFAATGFQLQQGPLLRVLLLRFDDRQHWFVLSLHHLIADGWSLGILARELSHFYQAALASRPAQLPPLPIQYADYACWQSHWLQAVQLEPQLAFWRQQLRDLQPLRLPTDRPYPALRSGSGATHPCQIAPDLGQSLKQLSRSHGVTLFMSLLAAFQTLLARYSGQTDILIGSVIANRNRDELEGLIGFFANTILLRTQVHGHEPFSGLLRQVRETCLEAYAHQDLPFEKLVEVLQPDRDLSRQPLFQVMLVFQNAPLPALELPGVHSEPLEVAPPTARFDLTLLVQPEEAGLKVAVEYNTDIFDCQTIERINGHYQQLLLQIAADPGTCLAQIDILSPAEQRQLEQWGGASQSYGGHHCLHEWFQQQVERTPQAEALAEGDRRLSYEELNRQANKLANYLRKQGAGPEAVVGLCLERSVEMVIGLLAILKAGAAYLPLEPNYPGQRLGYMLKDAGAVAVVTSRSSAPPLIGEGVRQVRLEEEWERIAEESPENPTSGVTPDNLAYIIYTSGSTGSPKGVAVSHHNVCRLFKATYLAFDFGPEDVWCLVHSFAFDFSVWELWGAWLFGGRLVVVPQETSLAPDALHRLILTEGITILNQTPSAFQQFLRVDELLADEKELPLRYVIFGGEALEVRSLAAWLERHNDKSPRIVNTYGITETTVHVTCEPIQAEDLRSRSSIGVPISDLQINLLDRYGKRVPCGVPGEIYVGGPGLSRGYINQAGLTAERFVPNPFSHSPGGRLYKTSDMGRWTADGKLEYLGRIDDQIKIRGFRIELAEIESTLQQCESVQQAVVLLAGDSEPGKRLIAYIVPERGARLQIDEISHSLRDRLPDFMVPAEFIFLDSMPLTGNGKIDRGALPVSSFGAKSQVHNLDLPGIPLEREIAQVWSEVLGQDGFGIHDNFFDVGGNSLQVVQVWIRIQRQVGKTLPIVALFQFPTISSLADYLACETRGTPETRGNPELQKEAIERQLAVRLRVRGRSRNE
jgi:amino acid adenylation domain-containing protein